MTLNAVHQSWCNMTRMGGGACNCGVTPPAATKPATEKCPNIVLDATPEGMALLMQAAPAWDRQTVHVPDSDRPIRTLSCCRCGEGTRGRQWWNRDKGYGLCVPCGEWFIATHGEKEATDMGGKRGVHWDVKEGA